MTEDTKTKWRGIGRFALKTAFYFIVIFILIYLYSYSGINSSHFIYNEF